MWSLTVHLRKVNNNNNKKHITNNKNKIFCDWEAVYNTPCLIYPSWSDESGSGWRESVVGWVYTMRESAKAGAIRCEAQAFIVCLLYTVSVQCGKKRMRSRTAITMSGMILHTGFGYTLHSLFWNGVEIGTRSWSYKMTWVNKNKLTKQ